MDIPGQGDDVFSNFNKDSTPTGGRKKGAFEAFDGSASWGGSCHTSEGVGLAPDSFDGFSGNGEDPEAVVAAASMEMEGLNIVPTPDSGSEGRRRKKKSTKDRKEDKPKKL